MTYQNKIQKILLLLSILGFTFLGQSQVQIFQNPANPYQFASKDIWNISLINPSQKTVQVKLKGFIKNSSGRVEVILNSVPVLLKPGMNVFNSVSLATARIQYINKEILEIEQITRSLPVGNYQLCVFVQCVKPNCDGEGSTFVNGETPTCIPLNLEPPTPLVLAFPEDEAVIKITRPTLTWIPPMPIARSSALTYKLTLVEKREKQSKIDALRRNRPLIQQRGISMNTLAFPMDVPALEKGKHYAWQVEAWVGRTYVASSQVWEFEIKEEEEKEDSAICKYYRLKKHIGLEVYTHSFMDTLGLIFRDPYNNKGSEWRVYLYNQSEVRKNNTASIGKDVETPIFIGKGNLKLVPYNIGKIKIGEVYLIEVQNIKHDKYFVRIKFEDK